MTKYFIGGILLLFGAIWSLDGTLYYGWLTATPLREGFLEIYQKFAIFWFWIFVLLSGLAFTCLIRLFFLWKKFNQSSPNP